MTNHQYINTSYHCSVSANVNQESATCQSFDFKQCIKSQLHYLDIYFLQCDLEEFKDRIEELASDTNSFCLKPINTHGLVNRFFCNDATLERVSHLSEAFSKCLNFLKTFERSELSGDDTSMEFMEKQKLANQCCCKYLEISSLIIIISLKNLCDKENPTLADLLYAMSLNHSNSSNSLDLTIPSEREESLMLKALGVDFGNQDACDALNESFTQLSVENSEETDLPSYNTTTRIQENNISKRVPVWMADNMHELYFVYRYLGLKSQDPNLESKTQEVKRILEQKSFKTNKHGKGKVSNHKIHKEGLNREPHRVHKKTHFLRENISTDPYNAVVNGIFESLLHQ